MWTVCTECGTSDVENVASVFIFRDEMILHCKFTWNENNTHVGKVIEMCTHEEDSINIKGLF